MQLRIGMSLVCVLGLVTSAARAELPAGEYTIAVAAERGLVLPSEISDDCETAPEGAVCIVGDIATDPTGKISGSAVLTSDAAGFALDLQMAVYGKMTGTTDEPKARLTFGVSGTVVDQGSEYTVSGSGRTKCVLEYVAATELYCRGTMKLCVYDGAHRLGCDRAPFETPLDFVRTPFDVHLDLVTSPRNAVTGNAEVLIEAGPVLTYTARGKYKPTTDTTNLKLVRVDPTPKTKVALKTAVLELGSASSGLVTFKIAGQKGIAVLSAPALSVH